MAKGIRALLDTVRQALPQVGNLGLLFFLLFFIFAALGVELFGKLGRFKHAQCATVVLSGQMLKLGLTLAYRVDSKMGDLKRQEAAPTKKIIEK